MRAARALAFSFLVIAAVASSGCRNTTRLPPMSDGLAGQPCPPWATMIDEPGLPNLRRVSDDLYCGAQPTPEGLQRLPTLGVKSILNLRTSDNDSQILDELKLRYFHMPMSAWDPRDEQVIQFLSIVSDERNLPLFLHCQHGADRTGMLCAMYRIAVQRWTKEQAIDELTRGGCGFSSFCANLVRYVRQTDVNKLKRAAGMIHQEAALTSAPLRNAE